MSVRHLSTVAMSNYAPVVELLNMGLRPKMIPCLVPAMDHRTIRRIAKYAGIKPPAGRDIESTRHHLSQTLYSPIAAIAVSLLRQRKARDAAIGPQGFLELCRTIENIAGVDVSQERLAVFLFTLWREYCNNMVQLKRCDCGYSFPVHRMSMLTPCTNCFAHSKRRINAAQRLGAAQYTLALSAAASRQPPMPEYEDLILESAGGSDAVDFAEAA